MFTDSPDTKTDPASSRARTTIIPLVGLAVVIALFVPALSAATGSVAVDAGERTAANDSLIVDYNDSVRVDSSADGYGDEITVTNSTGDVLDDGDDYDWNADIGAISFVEGGATTDGESVDVAYDAYDAPENTQRSLAFLGPLTSFLPWILVFIGGMVALSLVDEGWYR